jgi:hypothetical protein
MRTISASVGQGGTNTKPDAITVQKLLNQVPAVEGGPQIPLKVDGLAWHKTIAAIKRFQSINLGHKWPDGRVDPGGKTLARLNDYDTPAPGPTAVCTLYYACPPDVGGRPAGSGMIGGNVLGFAPTGAPSDADIINIAFRSSRMSLWDARGDLLSVTRALRAGKALSADQNNTYIIASKWLKLNFIINRPQGVIAQMEKAAGLMLKNHNLKTSNGGDVVITHAVGKTYHGESYGHPDLGLKCGDPFFSPDGPNCRRDVITHEFFHMIGVRHGGSALGGQLGPTGG